jgi:predicted enzyme related to lactoylglutathione lyase
MPKGPRAEGDFCWFNVLTPEPAEARAFFAELLGWAYDEIPGVGHTVLVGGHAVGGLLDLASPATPAGTPPLIGVMVKVASADGAAERVRSLGGEARPAFDVGGAGRMSVCHDPCGAELQVWEPRALLGTEVDARTPGAPFWFELMTTDVARATAFYEALFGWTSTAAALRGSTYTTFARGGVNVAGMLGITPAMGDARPGWVTYFSVSDAAETVQRATARGATVDMGLITLPSGGRIAGIVSPEGVPFRVAEHAR